MLPSLASGKLMGSGVDKSVPRLKRRHRDGATDQGRSRGSGKRRDALAVQAQDLLVQGSTERSPQTGDGYPSTAADGSTREAAAT